MEGEIDNGINIISKKTGKGYEDVMKYKGNFRDFNFHGEGERTYLGSNK